MQLKDRFLNAAISGELGKTDEYGTIITLKEFKNYFSDIKSDYINSFLPAATIEKGQYTATHTKYLFRIKKGIYRIHPEALELTLTENPERKKELIKSYMLFNSVSNRELAINMQQE